MAALANFFRIKPAYFTDDEYYEKLDKELTWLASMRDEGIRRIAARTVGLSPEAKQDLVEKVDEPPPPRAPGRLARAAPPRGAPRRPAKIDGSAAYGAATSTAPFIRRY